MSADPYTVNQFRPDDGHVSIGRGFHDEDSFTDALTVANLLADAGLVAVEQHVRIHEPARLAHGLTAAPPKFDALSLKPGVDFEVFPTAEAAEAAAWHPVADFFNAQPVPATPNALARVANEWTSLHNRLRDALHLADVDHSGNAYLKAIDKLQTQLDAVLSRNHTLTEERNTLLDQNAKLANEAARLESEKAELQRRLNLAVDTGLMGIQTVIEKVKHGPQVEYRTLRMNVTLPAEQIIHDREVAALIGQGWKVEYRQINTVVADGLASHYEFVKLVRRVLPSDVADPLKAAVAAAAEPPASTPVESVPVAGHKPLIVEAVPVATVPMNQLSAVEYVGALLRDNLRPTGEMV